MALLSRSCNTTTVYNNPITVYIVYIDSRQLYMYIYAAGPIHILYGWSLSSTRTPAVCQMVISVSGHGTVGQWLKHPQSPRSNNLAPIAILSAGCEVRIYGSFFRIALCRHVISAAAGRHSRNDIFKKADDSAVCQKSRMDGSVPVALPYSHRILLQNWWKVREVQSTARSRSPPSRASMQCHTSLL